MSLKKNLKEKILYTVLSAVFLAIGMFFDVIPSLLTFDNDKSSITTSLNSFEETDKEAVLQKEIEALKVHQDKLANKNILCEKAILSLEEKLSSENFVIGSETINAASGQELLKKLKVRQSDLQKKATFVNDLIEKKQEHLVRININKELLAEDMIDVEIQKLEMEKLEKEMAKLQGQIQEKKDSINQKLSVDNIDEEKTQIDNLINDLNTIGQ